VRIAESAQPLKIAEGDENLGLGPIVDEGAVGVVNANAVLVLSSESSPCHRGVRMSLQT